MGQRGFSLLEVLAALALLALLLLGVYSGVRSTLFSAGRGSASVARLDELRGAREFLRRELTSATALPWAVDEKKLPVVFEGGARQFRFVSALPGYLGKLGPQVIHVATVDDGKGSHDLVVTLAPLPMSQSATVAGTSEPLISRVRSLRVRYAKQGVPGWMDRWDDPMALPGAVEITAVPEEGADAWPPMVVSPRQDPGAVNVRGAAQGFERPAP